MKTTATNLAIAIGIIVAGIAICLAGIYVGEKDDAPGAALIGFLLMIGALVLAVRRLRRST
jgi:MYXO-CTERM domain-containing protein